MTVIRSVGLFVLAAIAEIGGAWLVWLRVREHRGLLWVGMGVAALGLYGFVATLQPDAHFGRILAAYGGISVAGRDQQRPGTTRRTGQRGQGARDLAAVRRTVVNHRLLRVPGCEILR